VTVTPGQATHLLVSAPSSATVGTPVNITVTAQDRYNNTATGYTGIVHFTSTDAQAALPANYTFAAADNGVHTFSGTFNSTGTWTVSATDTATSSITGTSGAVNVSPQIVATKLVVTSSVTTTTAGSPFTITVTAEDNSGNTATTYAGTVTFSSTDAQAVLPASYTFTAADRGVHTFSVTLKTVGANGSPQTITATDTTNNLTGSTSVSVTPSVATHFSLVFPSTVHVNTAYSITVTALDAYGNTATGYRGTIHFTSTLRRTVLPSDYTFTASDGGTHTFTNAVTFTRTGTATIRATDRANSSIAGSIVTVVSSTASQTARVSQTFNRLAHGNATVLGGSTPFARDDRQSGNHWLAPFDATAFRAKLSSALADSFKPLLPSGAKVFGVLGSGPASSTPSVNLSPSVGSESEDGVATTPTPVAGQPSDRAIRGLDAALKGRKKGSGTGSQPMADATQVSDDGND
jgi:hypothetical protein